MAIVPSYTTFSVSLDLSHDRAKGVIAMYLLARTYQDWVLSGNIGGDADCGSAIPARSNVVNTRTNHYWSSHVRHDANSMDNGGNGSSLVRGWLDWFSVPVTITIRFKNKTSCKKLNN